jgi:hypothetical protein
MDDRTFANSSRFMALAASGRLAFVLTWTIAAVDLR